MSVRSSNSSKRSWPTQVMHWTRNSRPRFQSEKCQLRSRLWKRLADTTSPFFPQALDFTIISSACETESSSLDCTIISSACETESSSLDCTIISSACETEFFIRLYNHQLGVWDREFLISCESSWFPAAVCIYVCARACVCACACRCVCVYARMCVYVRECVFMCCCVNKRSTLCASKRQISVYTFSMDNKQSYRTSSGVGLRKNRMRSNKGSRQVMSKISTFSCVSYSCTK